MERTMNEIATIIRAVTGRRGRGPGRITFDNGVEASSFDSDILRLAADNIDAEVIYTATEKPSSKDPTTIFTNLISLKITKPVAPTESEAPEASQEALGTIAETTAIPTQPHRPQMLATRPVEPTDEIRRLERSFALAVRQRILLEDFIKRRFKEGEHYMDGKTFGSKKKVLLQPGAQLILYCHGYAADFEIMGGPLAAPIEHNTQYTIVMKCTIKSIDGIQVGAGVGSCSSLQWSGRDMKLKPRGVSPDLTHNTTLKISKKRALVDSCLNATAAAEFFTSDLEEWPPVENSSSRVDTPRKGGFIHGERDT